MKNEELVAGVTTLLKSLDKMEFALGIENKIRQIFKCGT